MISASYISVNLREALINGGGGGGERHGGGRGTGYWDGAIVPAVFTDIRTL